jgi:hypothetical protein
MSHFLTAYVDGPEPAKLSELRAKTDRQILNLLHSRLELGAGQAGASGRF